MTDATRSASNDARPSSASSFQLPPAIVKMLSSFSFEPTRLCEYLLFIASNNSRFKRHTPNELSCTGVFLTALNFAKENDIYSAGGLLPASTDLEWASVRKMTAYVLAEAKEGEVRNLMQHYYLDDQEKERDATDDLSSVIPTTTLREAIGRIAPREIASPWPLDLPTLLEAVLNNKKARLQSRLESLGLSSLVATEALRIPTKQEEPPRQFNERPKVERELDESSRRTYQRAPVSDLRPFVDREARTASELSLGINVYAAALASVFRTAQGEFCFGLFGPWGIGKTRLAKSLEPLLASPDLYQSALRERGYRVGGYPHDDLHYEAVWYSAWKFRRPPEAWIFLYETMAAQCMNIGIFPKLGRILRVGVARNGYWPLIFGLLAIGVASIPLDSWLRFGALLFVLIGLGGLLYGFGVIRRGRETARSLATRYATLTRHRERLGLQALIGEDLRSLLVGWIPVAKDIQREPGGEIEITERSAFSDHPWHFALPILGLFALVWLWAMLWAPSFSEEVKASLRASLCGSWLASDGFWCSDKGASTRAIPSAYLVVFATWLTLCAFVLASVHRGKDKTDRVLLIIDDLDRCSPSDVIEITEALKLLLEDVEIQRRVQIIMLVDEQILHHAIALKFKEVIEDRVKRGGVDEEKARTEVIGEHIEKLFACHLRLPGLTDREVGELARRYAQGERLEKSNAARSDRPDTARLEDIERQLEWGLRTEPIPTDYTYPNPRSYPSQEPRRRTPLFLPGVPPNLTNMQEDNDPPKEIKSGRDLAKARLSLTMRREDWLRRRAYLEREREKLIRGTDLSSDDGKLDSLAGSKMRFTEEETDLLERDLSMIMKRAGKRASPRGIRMFLFKYRLCNLLIRLSHDSVGHDPDSIDPESVLTALGDAYADVSVRSTKDNTSRAALESIVAQVI